MVSRITKRPASGDYRHWVTLYGSTATLAPASTDYDAFGQLTTNTTTIFRTWAQIIPLRGEELQFARQLRGDVTHQVTIRYTTSMGPIAHYRWLKTRESRRLDIVDVINVEERCREYSLTCVEKV